MLTWPELKAELGELKNAKTALAGVLVLVVIATWVISALYYEGRIATNEAVIAALEKNVVPPVTTRSWRPSFAVTPLAVGAVLAGCLLALGFSQRRGSRLGREVARLTNEMGAANVEIAKGAALLVERDDAVKSLDIWKAQTANRTFNRWNKFSRVDGKKPTVVIRFAEYGDDYKIVEEIHNVFESRVGWIVERDWANKPPLKQSTGIKVTFGVGYNTAFDEIAMAFIECDVLSGVRCIGVQAEGLDQLGFEVCVLPS